MRQRFLRIVFTLALAAAAGWLFERLRSPLPWVLGPLFTPEVMTLLARLAPALGAAIVWALLAGYLLYRLLLAANPEMRSDRAGAFLAAAIGGASEMANLAQRHGGAAERVASAHSLRVLLVVAVLPFFLQWSEVHGHWPNAPAQREVHAAPLAVLLAISAAGIYLLQRWRGPNPWVLGALAVVTAFQVVRYVAVLLPTGPLYRCELIRLARHEPRPACPVHAGAAAEAGSARAQPPDHGLR